MAAGPIKGTAVLKQTDCVLEDESRRGSRTRGVSQTASPPVPLPGAGAEGTPLPGLSAHQGQEVTASTQEDSAKVPTWPLPQQDGASFTQAPPCPLSPVRLRSVVRSPPFLFVCF